MNAYMNEKLSLLRSTKGKVLILIENQAGINNGASWMAATLRLWIKLLMKALTLEELA